MTAQTQETVCLYLFYAEMDAELILGGSEHLNPPSDTMSFNEFVCSTELRPSPSVYSISSDESERQTKKGLVLKGPPVTLGYHISLQLVGTVWFRGSY